MEFIEKYSDKPWDWYYISQNSNITMNIIEKYPNKPWIWKYISMNPNITINFIEKYIDKPWNWEWISSNPIITTEFVEKYLDKPCDWLNNWIFDISQNLNINLYIVKYSGESYILFNYSNNPNILFKYISKYYKNKWKWRNYSFYPPKSISNNIFTKEKQLFIEEHYRKWVASYKIQNWYRNNRYNYNYKINRIKINKILF
jgi:hypothetical protein